MPNKNKIEALKELRDSIDNPAIVDIEIERLMERLKNQTLIYWSGSLEFNSWTDIEDFMNGHLGGEVDIDSLVEELNAIGNPSMVIEEFELSSYGNIAHRVSFCFKNKTIDWNEESKTWNIIAI